MKNKAYEIARNHKYDEYQRELASTVYKFFDKKIGSGLRVNKQLAEELHKPLIKKFKWRKFYVIFQKGIWAADLAEIGLLSSKNHNDKYFFMRHRCFY